MYFCKHQLAFMTIRLSITTIITQIFSYCKWYCPAQFAPILTVKSFVLHLYTEFGFLAIVWLFLPNDSMLLRVDTLRL